MQCWSKRRVQTSNDVTTQRGVGSALAILFLANLRAAIDRTSLVAILPAIKRDLVLSDTQLGLLTDAMKVGSVDGLICDPIVLDAPVSLKRWGIELRLVYAAPDARPANRDPHLIDLIRRAWAAW